MVNEVCRFTVFFGEKGENRGEMGKVCYRY